MGLSGQSLQSQDGSELLRWGARPTSTVGSRQLIGDLPDRALSLAVRRLDATLRRRQGIIEFTSDPHCILRVSVHQITAEILLKDGAIRRGEWIGEIHLWNEHILPMSHGGANMVWGAAMRRRLRRSLQRLAEFVESDPRFAHVKFFRGEAAFGPAKELHRTRCFAEGFGFEITEPRHREDWLSRLFSLGQALFLWGMVRTFNRGALRSIGRLTRPTWFQLWMSRETLLGRYGARLAEPAVAPVTSEPPC